jgi:hypothetical protein
MRRYCIDLENLAIIERETGESVANIPVYESADKWLENEPSWAWHMLNDLIWRKRAWVVVILPLSRDDYREWEQNVGCCDSQEFSAGIIGNGDTCYFVRTFDPDMYQSYYVDTLKWAPPDMTEAEVEEARRPFREKTATGETTVPERA